MRRIAAFAVAASAIAASLLMPTARNSAEPPPRPKTLPDFALPDAGMTVRKRSEWEAGKALVVIFTGTQCPQCNRFVPELGKIQEEYKAKGVSVIGINSNRNEQKEIAEHAKEHGVPFPILRDADHAVADALGIEVTPTALVVDSKWAIRYRGRIDRTQMGSATTGEDVRAALDAVLGGREVAKPETEARGCTVRRNEPKKEGAVTWTKDVAPIVYANCVQCHRMGQIGPMPLTDFNHASAFAQEIRSAVVAKRMPPWKPVGGQEFTGERKLTAEQIETIVKWVDGGTPEGDPKDEPAMPEFKSDWLMGEPDLVLDAGEDFEVRAGPDLYRHFLMPNKLTEDKWVSAVEVKPGNTRIVHHVLAYLDETGTAKRLDESEEGLGYEGGGGFPGFVPIGEMGGWTPGFFARPLPKGVARKLPKDATIVLQIHYNNPTGSAQKDRTKIGLYFAKDPVKQLLYQARILNPWFKIPAGEAAWEVNAAWPVNRDISVISVMPHCHLLGRKATMIAELPNGKETSLIEINDWDFKWQDTYNLKTPLHLPDGSNVRLTMTYDNSEDNPRNPNVPPVGIRWGEHTTDEMCLGYVNYVRDHEDLTKKKK
ncbi:MAG: redoxin family protein [Planctomycetes bacterium]|nr:redoxin family protein [Planctomycetota bacterium]